MWRAINEAWQAVALACLVAFLAAFLLPALLYWAIK